jgi:hypothetical protein
MADPTQTTQVKSSQVQPKSAPPNPETFVFPKVHLEGGPLLIKVRGGEVLAQPKDVIVTVAGEALVMSEDQYALLGGDYDTAEDLSEARAIVAHGRDAGITKDEALAKFKETHPESPTPTDDQLVEQSHPVRAAKLRELEMRPLEELAPELTRPKPDQELPEPPKLGRPEPTPLPATK